MSKRPHKKSPLNPANRNSSPFPPFSIAPDQPLSRYFSSPSKPNNPTNPGIHRSRYPQVSIPAQDIVSYVFSGGDAASRARPQYFDAHDPSRCYSLDDAARFTKRIALGLQRNVGLSKGGRALLFAGNNVFFPALLWGVIAGEGVFTACSPAATAAELEFQLKDSEAEVLLCGANLVDTALEAATAAGVPTDRVFVFCDPLTELAEGTTQGLRSWASFWASEEEAEGWMWKQSEDVEWLRETTAILNYSSGTTGTPKAVEISHRNVVANSAQLIYYRTLVADTPEAKARAERLQRNGERWLAPLPMYHAYGQMYYCINAPRQGAKVFIMSKYDIKQLLFFIDVYRITMLTGVPVLMVQISKQPPEKYNLNSVEYALNGSAPLGADIARIIDRNFLREGLGVKQGFGMTEVTCSVTGFTHDDEIESASVGYLNPNCMGKIVPVEGYGEGTDAPDGAIVGEFWVSGENVMKGYFKRDRETNETIVHEDGVRWLRTGDIAYFDKDEKVYLVDRMKELIKVRGFQVAPAELEQCILELKGVADAAVVGAKINNGEYPRAFVVKGDESITEDKVKDQVASKLAKHKHLTGGVYFIDEIPRTASGKVMKRKLPDVPARENKL